jgi:hypothetical protein
MMMSDRVRVLEVKVVSLAEKVRVICERYCFGLATPNTIRNLELEVQHVFADWCFLHQIETYEVAVYVRRMGPGEVRLLVDAPRSHTFSPEAQRDLAAFICKPTDPDP